MRLMKMTVGALAVCGAMTAASASAAVIQTVQFNFATEGDGVSDATWNNIELPARVNGVQTPGGQVFSSLVDSDGNATSLVLTMDEDNVFAGGGGPTSDVSSLSGDAADYFIAGTHNTYAWGYTHFGTNSPTFPMAEMTLSGLDTSLLYDFTFLAWRSQFGQPNREGTLTLIGANTASVELSGSQPAGGGIEQLLGIVPDANGEILIRYEDIPEDGGESNSFYYLNGMVVEVVPEPATLGLMGLGGLVLLARRRRK